MSQQPDHQPGAYYVSIIKAGAAPILALGPFTRHRRALGLVDAVRLLVRRAELDPWCEFGYGTSRLPLTESPMPTAALNELMHVGHDWRGPVDDTYWLSPKVLNRLREAL